jgi:hypothetical protein
MRRSIPANKAPDNPRPLSANPSTPPINTCTNGTSIWTTPGCDGKACPLVQEKSKAAIVTSSNNAASWLAAGGKKPTPKTTTGTPTGQKIERQFQSHPGRRGRLTGRRNWRKLSRQKFHPSIMNKLTTRFLCFASILACAFTPCTIAKAAPKPSVSSFGHHKSKTSKHRSKHPKHLKHATDAHRAT